MQLEKQYCSMEQSKRLKELGIAQTSIACFIGAELHLFEKNFYNWAEQRGLIAVAAFTVAELGVMLPTLGFEYVKSNRGNGKDFFWASSSYWRVKNLTFDNENEAQMRAAMLIYLLENNLLTAEEVNTRLLAL